MRASQRPDTKLVDIYYDVADVDSTTVAVSAAVSTNGGASYTLPVSSIGQVPPAQWEKSHATIDPFRTADIWKN